MIFSRELWIIIWAQEVSLVAKFGYAELIILCYLGAFSRARPYYFKNKSPFNRKLHQLKPVFIGPILLLLSSFEPKLFLRRISCNFKATYFINYSRKPTEDGWIIKQVTIFGVNKALLKLMLTRTSHVMRWAWRL